MRPKRPSGRGKGRAAPPKPRKSPRVGSPPAATSDSRGLVDRATVPLQKRGSLGQPRLSCVVPGAFGGHADTACRKWLEDLDATDTLAGHLESAVLLVVGREAVLESVCIPDGADRFRFVGALRLLAHRLERGMVDDD